MTQPTSATARRLPTQNDSTDSALSAAAKKSNTNELSLLLSNPLRIKYCSTDLNSAVLEAIVCSPLDQNPVDCVRVLLTHGADPNCVGRLGSALYVAVELGCELATLELLERGADANWIHNGPVFLAPAFGTALTTCSVSPPYRPDDDSWHNKRMSYRQTPLHRVCHHGLTLAADALLRHGPDVNATVRGHREIVSLLLNHPATDTTVRDRDGATAFLYSLDLRYYHSGPELARLFALARINNPKLSVAAEHVCQETDFETLEFGPDGCSMDRYELPRNMKDFLYGKLEFGQPLQRDYNTLPIINGGFK